MNYNFQPENTEYRVIEERWPADLSDRVQNLLKKGWFLSGGISVSIAFSPGGSKEQTYCQAMIRPNKLP